MDKRTFSFESLDAYRVARRLVCEVYELQKRFPVEERYALCDQIRRAVISVTSNIAEGCGRKSYKEKIHFIEISFGSLTETFSQLINAQDLGYLSENDVENIRPLFNHVAALLSNLKKRYERETSKPYPLNLLTL